MTTGRTNWLACCAPLITLSDLGGTLASAPLDVFDVNQPEDLNILESRFTIGVVAVALSFTAP